MSLPAWPAAYASYLNRARISVHCRDQVGANFAIWIPFPISQKVTEGLLRSDLKDLRIYDATGAAELARVTNNNSTHSGAEGIGFAYPRAMTYSTEYRDIWVYFNNASESGTPATTNPFYLFDSFDAGIDSWTQEEGVWTHNATNGTLQSAVISDGVGDYVKIPCDMNGNIAVEVRVFVRRVNSAGDTRGYWGLHFPFSTNMPGVAGCFGWKTWSNYTTQIYNCNGVNQTLKRLSYDFPGFLPLNNQWVEWRLRITNNGSGAVEIWVSPQDGIRDGLFFNETSWSSGLSHLHLGVTGVAGGSQYQFDCLRVTSGSVELMPIATVEIEDKQVTADITAPGPASGFTATAAASDNYIDLAWTNPVDADFEEVVIYRNTEDNEGTSTEIARSGGTSFRDGGLASSTHYFYWLKAADTSQNLSTSVAADATTSSGSDVTPPNAPTGGQVTAWDDSPASVTTSWIGVSDADHYDILRTTDPREVGTIINSSNIAQAASPYTITYTDNAANSTSAPTPGRTYYYRLRAYDLAGNVSQPSNAVAWHLPSGSATGLAVRDGSIYLQKAIIERINALNLHGLTHGKPAVKAYDRVPTLREYPYVTVWDQTPSTDFMTKDIGGQTLQVTIDVHSQYQGFREAEELASQILLSLTGDKIDLSAYGFEVIRHQRVNSVPLNDPDGQSVRVVQRVLFVIQDTQTVQTF